MNDVIYLSGEPYSTEDVRAKSDPDEFINEEEWNDWLDIYGYNPDDYGRYEQ